MPPEEPPAPEAVPEAVPEPVSASPRPAFVNAAHPGGPPLPGKPGLPAGAGLPDAELALLDGVLRAMERAGSPPAMLDETAAALCLWLNADLALWLLPDAEGQRVESALPAGAAADRLAQLQRAARELSGPVLRALLQGQPPPSPPPPGEPLWGPHSRWLHLPLTLRDGSRALLLLRRATAALALPAGAAFAARIASLALDRALLLAVRRRWELSFEAIPEPLALCNGDGRVLRANQALRNLAGPADSTTDLDQVLRPLQLPVRVAEAMQQSGVLLCDEAPQGAGRTYTAMLSPIREPAAASDGTAPEQRLWSGHSGAVLMLHDNTDEKRMHRHLLLGERMAAVGQLAAGLAHEINNPVSVAYSNLQIARELLQEQRALLPPDLAELVDMVDESLAHITRVRDIVRDLRTFTSAEVRSAAGESRLDDIIDLALRITRSEMSRRARLVFDRDLSPLPPVRGDSGRLSHVVMNLLSHAQANLPPLEVSGPAAHSITVRTRLDRARSMVELVVADSGPTLSEEARAHLFEPFGLPRWRLPPGLSAPLGMGLAVSYEVVRRLGGEIEARPGGRGGNEMVVRLPLYHKSDPVPSGGPPRGRVLFVDEEPLLLRHYVQQLGHLHDLTTVSTAAEALALLEAEAPFDAVCCSLRLNPDGQDGLERPAGEDGEPGEVGAALALYRSAVAREPRLSRRFVFLCTKEPRGAVLGQLSTITAPVLLKPVQRDILAQAIETAIRA